MFLDKFITIDESWAHPINSRSNLLFGRFLYPATRILVIECLFGMHIALNSDFKLFNHPPCFKDFTPTFNYEDELLVTSNDIQNTNINMATILLIP